MQRSRIAAAAGLALALAVLPAAAARAAGAADKQLAVYEAELAATERTLAEAAQAVKDPKLPPAKVDALAVRLEQHRSRLGDQMALLEARQEEVRNQRDAIRTKFQELDRKTNEIYERISQTLRALSEIRRGTFKGGL